MELTSTVNTWKLNVSVSTPILHDYLTDITMNIGWI